MYHDRVPHSIDGLALTNASQQSVAGDHHETVVPQHQHAAAKNDAVLVVHEVLRQHLGGIRRVVIVSHHVFRDVGKEGAAGGDDAL